MPSSCKDLRAALADCLQHSDCVLIDRNKPADCLKAPLRDGLPTRCQQLQRGYGECKRGLVDMRKRFRGNMPFNLDIGSRAEKRGQLYAGGPSIGSLKEETKSDNPEDGLGGPEA